MEVGHELIVITWLHQANREVLKGHPRSDESRPLTGVFYTRSPARPNPLGLHPVTVRAIEGTRLKIGPIEAFDGIRAALLANRAQFYRDLPAGPFYGFNRPGAKVSEGVIGNWWRQGMIGGAKPQYDCIKAFSETDFTEDLQSITVPVLIMHGDDDQIVPFADSAPLSAKLVKNATLKVYPGLPHGMCTTHPEVINKDLLAFIKS